MSSQNARRAGPPVCEKVVCKHCGSHRVRVTEIDIIAGRNSVRCFPDGGAYKGSPDDEPSISATLVCRDCTRCTGLTVGQNQGQIMLVIGAFDPPDPLPRPTLH